MKKIILASFLFSGALSSQAQDVHLFVGGGIMNYQGDLQPRRLTLSQAKPYVTVGGYYELTEKLWIRAGIVAGKVTASDSVAKLNQVRNLSFSSQVIEFHLGAEYDILNSYEHLLTPYIFASVAGFHFNPYTQDINKNKVYLQPLGTEGQGFFQGRKKYGLTQLSVPFGGGIKIAVSENIQVRLEAVLRKLFTDYLDDVSTFYVNQANLLSNNGQQAVDLAFRSDEINPLLQYPNEGNIRGNPKSKDFYYTGGVSVSFRLQGNPNRGKPGKGKLGCPVNVY
jgi:hypothetical protein